MDNSQPDPAGPVVASTDQRKSKWDTVLTTTPVILTVMGTVLAGLSSSEMTLAQYYRTLAAQSQSKAANQWNFFQVKRIRGTSLEVFLDLLPAQARATTLDAPSLLAAANAHLRELRRCRAAAARLQQAVVDLKAEGTAGGADAVQAAERLVKLADAQVQAAEKAHGQLVQRANAPETQAAFALIGSRDMPTVAIVPIANELIAKEIRAMSSGQEEAEALLQLRPGDIDPEIRQAESNTRNVELALEAPEKVLDELGKFVRAQLLLTAALHQLTRDVVAMFEELADTDSKMYGTAHKAAGELRQRDAALVAASDDLKNLYKSADHGYTARRYRWEADFNRQTAQLYELQVRKQSLDAERHRERSRLFFFGLLFAQAGTAIATMALAARQQSVLWGIASVAGLAALGFSLFVYLTV